MAVSRCIHTLEALPGVQTCLHFTETESTNTLARLLAPDPGDRLVVIVADRQHAGRGRRNRTFFSSHPGGLWVTVVLNLRDLAGHFAVTQAISCAIVKALKEHDPHAPLAIKWPNDIYWGDKKICGILLESIPHHPRRIAAGFGLNCTIPARAFPPELRKQATSIAIETGRETDRTELLTTIIHHFDTFRKHAAPAVYQYYHTHLYRRGTPVRIDDREGIFRDVTPEGYLVLDTGDSSEHIVSGTLTFME